MTINNEKIKIDDSYKANSVMNNMIDFIEHRVRYIYELGFEDGYIKGLKCATEQVVEQVVEQMLKEVK